MPFVAFRLRIIPADHMDLPAQAIPCRLVGVESVDGKLPWNSEIVEGLSAVCMNKPLLTVVKVQSRELYTDCIPK